MLIDDRFDLGDFGVKGKAIHTPGHTPSSISVILDSGGVIISGDLSTGCTHQLPMFAMDFPRAKESLRRVVSFEPAKIYFAHGGFLEPEIMQESDGLIIATPIYFAGITAQTKAWLDRIFSYIGMDLSPKLPRSKKSSFIFTQNQPNAVLFQVPIATFMKTVGLTGLPVKDYLLAYDLDARIKTPMIGKREFMEKTYLMGNVLLW